jgi:hypothetical protein
MEELMYEDAGAVFAFLMAIIIPLLIIGFVFYLVDAIARFKYLKIRGYTSAWMAFIPLLNVYSCVDATYGNVDKIKIFGIELPAIVVKLYPVIVSVLTGIISNIPKVGGLSTIVWIIQIAFGVAVFIDMQERLGKEVSTGFAIVANIIAIIAPIKLLMSCSGIGIGAFDYSTDQRVLKSQAGTV